MLKECKDCGERKHPDEFYGRQGECKECTKERSRRNARNVSRKCQICGNEFGTCNSEIRRGGGLTCSRQCFYERLRRKIKRGANSHAYKGGRIKAGKYIKVLSHGHPNCDAKGYVFDHILVMEKHLGRVLSRGETVHHIDEDKTNNRIDNLMLFPTTGAHTQYHWNKRKNII